MVDSMNQEVSIVVPSTTGINVFAPELHATCVKLVLTRLAELFGGATALRGQGAWMSETAGLVVEDVTEVSSHTTEIELAKHQGAVIMLAQDVASIMEQECVAVTISGTMTFHTPKAKASQHKAA